MQSTVNGLETRKDNVKDQYQRAKSKGENLVAGASAEFRDFVADIEDLIKATTSLSGPELEEAKRRLNDRVQAAKDSVQEIGGNVIARAKRTAAMTNDYVYDQPWTAIGVGAALGLLVGFLASRRSN